MARAATAVHVRGPGGFHRFAAGEELPDWAAEAISNPRAIVGGEVVEADTEGGGMPSDDDTKDVWLDYAARNGVEVSSSAKKGDIVAAVKAAADGESEGE